MSSLRLAWLGSLWILALAPACQSKGVGPSPTGTQAEGKQVEGKQAGAAMSQAVSAADAAPEVSAAGSPEPGSAEPPAEPDKALGAHLADPRWYRKTMFGEGAKVLDTKRSQADDQGRFSSLIRFELSDMTVEACADHLEQKVAGEVSNVQREVQADGRIQLEGSTDRYSLTFICGEAKGKTIAYVSYQWT
ncbi:hypothetical protein [Paraliomyxa miuraensis]|uniref:hypothetical protein n=1 Tax=Paraliomyxa miuraensis TaxID=376150 RepID=UPI0022523422|nr:hypothetical protein [Paraliomyxa miuraensis]MCX4243773.1 hypothetical protein [Paraliomyxa miuraensis]